MAQPVIRDVSLFGVEAEVTEGTYVAPSAATSYFQPDEDGFEFTPTRELLERSVMNASVGASTPKLGMKAAAGTAKVEMRASGTEGADVDFGLFLKGALGATRSIASTTTTKSSGNTATVLQIQDADISKFNAGDIIVTKGTGAHHVCVVTAVDSTGGAANLTVSPAHPSGDHADSVVISKSTMYYTANTGHPALSLSYYWGNVKRQAALGAKIKSFGIDGYTPGQLPKFLFGWEALTYTEIAGVAPHTPTFDTGTPPVILEATIYKDGTALLLNKFTLALENTLGYLTDVGSANGRVKSRVTERKITGTINPYMDDTDVSWFTAFNAGTEFSLFARAYIPSSTSGEITMGSVVGIWLPKCMLTTYKHGDADGLVTDDLAFQAVRGAAGSSEEMYVGLI